MSKVRLVGITKSLVDGVDSHEGLLAYIARVSNPSNQLNTDTAPKLLKYLVNNKHWSPFEMVHMVLEIETTRDIARQILRHRSFAFQEFSQRYAIADLGFEFKEARLQDKKNRQSSLPSDDKELLDMWDEQQADVVHYAKEAYHWAISNGIAKEQARAVLPEGLTVSRMYMAGSLRSWLHYCSVRCDISTQKEHRDVANMVKEIIVEQFPSLSQALNDI